MKKKIAKFLQKVERKLNPQYHPVRNWTTYWNVCVPRSDGMRGIDYDKMIKELSRRTGIDENICAKIYNAEDEVLYEIGIIN